MRRSRLPALALLLLAAAPALVRAQDATSKTLPALLVDSNAEIRATAVRGLLRIPTEQAVEMLLPALEKESDLEVTMACVCVAGELASAKAVPALLKLFQRKLKDDTVTLGMGGDLDAKIRELEDVVRKAKEPDKQAKAQEQIKDLQNAKEQRRLAQLRMQAVYLLVIDALGRIGASDATAKLLDLVTSENPSVRCCALGALANIRDDSIRPALEKMLTSTSAQQRLCAIRGLEDLDTPVPPGAQDTWVQRAIACMVVKDVDNSDRTIAATALQWAMDLGAGPLNPIVSLPRIIAYRDLLRGNDRNNPHLVDFELLAIYLKQKVVQRAQRPTIPQRTSDPGATVETK